MMLHLTSTIWKGWCHIRSCIECIEQGKSVLFTCPFISSIWEMDTGQIYWMNWLPIALLTSIQNIKPISVCIYHNFPMKKIKLPDRLGLLPDLIHVHFKSLHSRLGLRCTAWTPWIEACGKAPYLKGWNQHESTIDGHSIDIYRWPLKK